MSGDTVFGWFHVLRNRVYPLTIVAARYQGVYEGAAYLAFPCDPDAIPPGWNQGDTACADWFHEHRDAPIGRGASPSHAHADLVERLRTIAPAHRAS